MQARETTANKLVAIKVVRSHAHYRHAARCELRVLDTLKAHDPDNKMQCVHARDWFDFFGHVCIVMDLLDASLFDFLQNNSCVPFPASQVRSFARQLFTSVACEFSLHVGPR